MQDLQDFAHTAVPENEGPRFKWLYLTNVEAAVAVCVPVFMFGATLGQSLSMMNLLIALVIGGGVLSIISGYSSYIGVKTRLSTALLVKESFGAQGAKIVWLILACASFGWFGLQTEVFAKALIALIGKISPTLELNNTLIIILSGFLMSSTAVIGIKGVGKLAQLSMPLLLGVLIYALSMALAAKGYMSWWNYTPANPMQLGTAIASIIGAYAIGAIIMPNVKRFAKNKSHSISSAVLALGVFYPILLLLTAATAYLMKEPDFIELLLNFGLGWLTMIILLLATWTTNDINLYGASLALAPVFPKIKRNILTAIAGTVGTAIACFGIFENMTALFMILGVLTTPLFIIYCIDFKMRKFSTRVKAVSVHWTAFAAWILSSSIGIWTTPADQWGMEMTTITTVPALDSLLAAVVIYPIILWASKIKKSL
ncbi:MAG: cytosine permease [Lactobacillales bacterium]|jgi:cytosine permease|nr:cytosine permease [Lactobacillales bacterium]